MLILSKIGNSYCKRGFSLAREALSQPNNIHPHSEINLPSEALQAFHLRLRDANSLPIRWLAT